MVSAAFYWWSLSGSTVGVVVSLLSKLRDFAPIAVLLSSYLYLWSLPLTVNLVQFFQLAFDHAHLHISVQLTPHIKDPAHDLDAITVALESSTCL